MVESDTGISQWGGSTHNKLALWSIVTIRLILCNFSKGTFNQRLNASVN